MISVSSHPSSSILIIEDSDVSRSIISTIFNDAGYDHLYFAKDGVEGLNQTFERTPDLVILDLVMPRMDGYEYLKSVRANPQFSNLPIIVQTSLSDSTKHAQAFAAGASDLIMKPIVASELIARSSVHLENQLLLKSLTHYRQRLDFELMQAREMQLNLLPAEKTIQDCENRFKLDIASCFLPSEELSGDLWGLKPIDEHRMALYQVDFTGHGVMAALNTFRLHTLIETKLQPHARPGEYLSELNRYLHGLLMTREFATMFYGVVDTKQNRLDYAAAASTNPILLSNGDVKVLEGTGIALSMSPDATYPTRSITFNPGDTLIAYSDALIEKQRLGNQSFDENKLQNVCRDLKENIDSQTVLKTILSSFQSTTGDDHLDDDLTITVMQRK